MPRALFGVLAAGAACALLAMPTAGAQPDDDPTPEPAPAADCNAAGLSATISSVTEALSEHFADNPETNQALIDITREPAFAAVGQFEGYFNERPEEADEIRAIKQPLVDFQHRCGMQVTPAEALTVLSEL